MIIGFLYSMFLSVVVFEVSKMVLVVCIVRFDWLFNNCSFKLGVVFFKIL